MGTFTIGEAAERTGFTASALRYYEAIGLVPPSSRTAGGYRVYDDDAVARLSFIARAKVLGCTLDEVADLVRSWDGGACGPVQRRLHDLVTGKASATQRRIEELTVLAGRLQAAAGRLGATPSDGPCADRCACATAAAVDAVATAPVGTNGVGASIACTLEPAALPERLERWRAVVDGALTRTTTAAGDLRLTFDERAPLADLVELVAAERACCPFLSFAVTVDGRGMALEVAAPEGAEAVIASLFGEAT